MQFRIGPTTASVMSRNMTPSGRIAQRTPLLVRVFFVYEGDHKILVLHAYDKTKDVSRLSQQREIGEARRNLEKMVELERLIFDV
jgi:phage-related protein